MAAKNYYNILGVKQTDSEDAIKQAYRKLAKKYHPDLNPGDKAAEAKMREIGEAYDTIGDVEKRKKYDQELSGGGKQKPFAAGPSKAPTSNRPMTQEDFHNMTRSFDNMFSPESIRDAAKQKASRKPMDSADFFANVIGFKGPNKKG